MANITRNITQADIWDNVRDFVSEPRTDSQARIIVATTAASIIITITGSSPDGLNTIGVIVDGVIKPGISASGSIALGTEGIVKRVELINSAQSSGGVLQERGAYVTAIIYTDTTSVFNIIPPGYVPNRICMIGDSIAVGVAAPYLETGAAIAILRRAYSRPVINMSWAYSALTDLICNGENNKTVNATKLNALVARVVAANPYLVWIEIGINDFGLYSDPMTAAQFSTAYSALVDAIHTALPSVKLILQTLFDRNTSGTNITNAAGATLYQFRHVIREIGSARAAYCNVVEGSNLVPASLLHTDNLHLSEAGQAKLAESINAYLISMEADVLYGNWTT